MTVPFWHLLLEQLPSRVLIVTPLIFLHKLGPVLLFEEVSAQFNVRRHLPKVDHELLLCDIVQVKVEVLLLDDVEICRYRTDGTVR